MGPRCPNHRVPLTDCSHGVGICPISGCHFSYKGNEEEQIKKLKLNSLGQMVEVSESSVKQVEGEALEIY